MSERPGMRASSGLGFLDPELHVAALDGPLADLLGVSAHEQVGRPFAEVAPAAWAALEPLLRRTAAGESFSGCPFPAAEGERRMDVRPLALENGRFGVALAVEDDLLVRSELHAMLARTNRAVSRCRSADELYRQVCEIAVETGGFRFAWVGALRDGQVVPVAMAGHDPAYLDGVVVTLDPADRRSQGPTGHAARTGASVVVNDLATSAITAPWHDRLDTFGFAASAAFPIKERRQVVAVMTVYAERAGFFTDELVATLSELTPNLSFALDAFASTRDRLRDELGLQLRDRAMQAISQGIVIIDALAEGMPVVYASPGFELVTGYTPEEIVGRSPSSLRGPDTDTAVAAALDDAVRRRETCSVELLNYRKDGTPFWNAVVASPIADADGVVTHFVATQTDVTARRELEEQMRRMQRLEALGQLAGGVAHDFNNLLTVIIGSALIARERADPETGEILRDILDAGDRATDLVRQLLAFSRRQSASLAPVDLNDLVDGAKRMLDRLIESSIEIRYELAGRPVIVAADRGQLEQVLVNLALNARDAMPNGGTLTIRTGVAGDRPVPAGTLTVADTGTGIDPELHERIFLPFFTTKEEGAGTGLGLAAVYGIAAAAGGTVALDSTTGEGATFTVSLPLAGADPEPPQQDGAQESERVDGLRAVLVEDNTAVRAVTEKLLRAAGCTLVLVATPEDALDLVAADEPFDVLVTDIVMPKRNGVELALAIRQLRPTLPVLFVSGYPQDKFADASSLPESVYLAKPFTQESLQRALSELCGPLPR